MADEWTPLPGVVTGEQSSDENPTWGDYGKTAAAGVVGGVAAPLAGLARRATDGSDTPEGKATNAMSKLLEKSFSDTSDEINASRSDVARKRAEATVTSKEFWDHPISSGMLKMTGATPAMAAMIFSGGPIGAAIVGGALSAGSYDSDVDKVLDGSSDKQLKENEWYAGLRSMGMSEDDARTNLKSKLIGHKDLFNFAAGAVAGAIGPAGKLAAGATGKSAAGLASAETGAGARAGIGAAEGAAGGGLQGGVNNATLQQTEIEAGTKKKFDDEALVNAVLEPAGIGGAMGVLAGAAVKPKSKSKPKKASDGLQVADQTVQEQNRGAADPVVEAPTPVATQATPDSGSPAQVPVAQVPGAKGEAIKNKGKAPKAEPLKVTTVDELGPSPEQALAMKPDEVPPEVKAAAQNPELAPKAPRGPAAIQREIGQPYGAAARQAEAEGWRAGQPAPKEPVAPEVTPEVTPAPAQPEKSVVPAAPEIANVSPQPVIAPEKSGRVLKNMSVEGRANEKAAKDKAAADLKAANAEAKEAGERKRGEQEKTSIAERAKHAEEIVNAIPKTTSELPTTSADRQAMGSDLGRVLAAAGERGLVPRESLPKDTQKTDPHAFHLSIPQKVGDAGMSPHVRYLREVMDVKKALESKAYGPKSKARARVLDFINEHGDLEAMAERRKVDGNAAKAVKQGDVEAPSGKVAEAMAGSDHANESTQSPEERMLAKEEASGEDAPSQEVEQGRSVKHVKDATEKSNPVLDKRAARKAALVEAAAKEKARSEGENAAASAPKKVEISAADKAKYASTQTPEERAAWLKAKAEKAAKAAEPKPDLVDNLAEKPRKVVDVDTKEVLTPLKSTTAKEVLKSLDLSHLSGVPKALAEFAKKRLTAAVGDRAVHILAQEDMARATGDFATAFADASQGVTGQHNLYTDGSGGHILLRHDALRTPQQTAHTALHEIVHAETSRALFESPLIHKRVSRMMVETREALKSFPKDIRDSLNYALSNPREFLAEAHSNPVVQEILTHIPMSKELAAELRLEVQRKWSMWDGVIANVREAIEKLTGRLPDGHRMIEGILRTGEHIESHNLGTKTHENVFGRFKELNKHGVDDPVLSDNLNAKQAGEHAADALVNIKGKFRRGLNRVKMNNMIVDGNEHLSGPGLGKVVDLQAQRNAEKDRILASNGGRELVARTAELERTHPEAMSEGSELAFDASAHGVNLGPHAVNDFGKDSTKGWQPKSVVDGLQRRYDALDKKAPEVAEHLQNSVKFFKTIHDEVSMDTIKNVLKVADIDVPGLADRIFKDGLTDADKAQFGEKSGVVSALNAATNLKELKGWYIPFRRYGDFISTGEHELSVPKNGTKVNDNAIQFYDDGKDAAMRRAAEAYVTQDEHTPQGNKLINSGVDRVYVDANDPSKLLDKSDPNSKVAYRVRMQTQHTEFHETEAAATNNREALEAAGLQNTKVHKREEAHRSAPGMEGALGSVVRSLEHNESYNKLEPTQKEAVRQSLMAASVRSMSSTNIKTSMAHRRNVAGMARDLGRVAADYARMSANHLANLRFGPKITDAFGEMREHIKAYENDKDNIKREEIYQELHGRVYGRDAALADRAPNNVVRKLLQVSRSARLAGVSFHVINSMEPLTTSLPWIAGRHGVTSTTKEILRAYNTVGGLGALRGGIADTVRAYKNNNGFTDYVQMFKDNIARDNTMGGSHSKFLMDTLDYANARGLWGNDAIFEVGKSADPTGNAASRALDRIDLMANQVGSAVEGNNRAVTLIAAATLEFRKNGGNHMAAMDYAYRTAVTTMGDYSSGNASPLFNTRGGQMALQFKKFALKSYNMLGKSMAGTLRGDPESAKQFIGLMVTHATVAGALGLPGLEPVKIALIAANAFGLTGYTPGDLDDDVRQMTARVFGKKGGEVFSHGVFRGAGIEVSNRMGWDNLLTYGQPNSQKPNDIKSWLWDTMAGAPAGYIIDQFAAGQALMKGDIATAITKAAPIRAISDVTKAVTGAMGPKLSPQGREQQDALTPYQAGVRALGFTPSATAESGAMRSQVAGDSKKLTAARSQLVNDWVTGKDKAGSWRAIQKWNGGQAKEARIEMKDLTSAAKRRDTEEENGTVVKGIRIGKRTKSIYDAAASTYNP